jgi:hypothetical protein
VREPGRDGRRVALPVDVIAGWEHGRRVGPHHVTGRHQFSGPSGLHPQLRLDAARRRGDERARVAQLSAGEQHLQGVRIGRSGFGVQVIAVIPDRHQPQVGDRGEGGRPRPDHGANLPAAASQEAPVTLGRPQRVVQGHERLGTERRRQGRLHPRQVPSVRHDDHRAASTVDRRRDRLGQPRRPDLPG